MSFLKAMGCQGQGPQAGRLVIIPLAGPVLDLIQALPANLLHQATSAQVKGQGYAVSLYWVVPRMLRQPYSWRQECIAPSHFMLCCVNNAA